MVQNYAFFEQHSVPGAGGNIFKDITPLPRGEAACVCCARLDWLERRYKLRFFANPPNKSSRRQRPEDDVETTDDEEGRQGDMRGRKLLQINGEYYLQNENAVADLLSVQRYATRWPLIPKEELYASSVQHPDEPRWQWLLHTRRVPVTSNEAASAPLAETPKCAGVGDSEIASWVCWECLSDLAAPHPRMPLYALANDNWIGRERLEVRETSEATRWLSCLGRVCWKQVRLGRGAPNTLQKGITGNTVFLAQPSVTLNSETLELPPERDALVDSVNIAFTGSTGSLKGARWATVKREEYMKLVRRRQRECPAYKDATVNEEASNTRLPVDGVPEHLEHCVQQIEGLENAPVQLSGPASRAPERGMLEEAGEASEESSEMEGDEETTQQQESPSLEEANANVSTASIAVDPSQDPKDTQMLEVLKAQITQLEHQAKTVFRRERTGRVENADGVLQPVEDTGGRQRIREVIMDVKDVASGIGRSGQVALEAACTSAEQMRSVDTVSLAVPTKHKPLQSWDPRTWPACFTEWWFGDGAPNLARDRPMLFEELAPMLLDREELEYALDEDQTVYTARAPSRFVAPEIVAVLGDVRRRLALLRGTRMQTQRQGFRRDLEAICSATPADYEAALGLSDQSILGALAHKEVAKSVKTALRTLLLSTSDIPGTEGHKVALRHDGHGNNLFFGAAAYFCTANFADNYSPLMWLLHNGPGPREHLTSLQRSQAKDNTSATEPRATSGASEMLKAQPKMPPLERMHQVSAANPRAQAKFWLLEQELFHRYCVGLGMLHIGRMAISSFPRLWARARIAVE